MLFQWIRIIKSISSVLTDVSLDNQNESGGFVVNASETDYLYIGKYYPFNNFYSKVSVPNDETSSLSIQYWAGEGNGWKDAVDVIDATSVSGKTLSQSGLIQFSPHRLYSWGKIYDTSETSGTPTELQSLTIYNLYWLRLKFSAVLKDTTEIKKICYAFTQSQQLNNLDNLINNYLTSFQIGKTSWEDEIITASEYVINDMRSKGIIKNEGQILRINDVSIPTDWRTLAIIYYSLGPSFEKQYIEALRMYEKTLNIERMSIDENEDGYLDDGEKDNHIRRLIR